MIIRTFACNDCDAMFEVTGGMNDPDPECPACNMVMDWRPTSFNIGGSTEGKAVKVAQEILETEYGLTNYKDNNREGDVGYIDPLKKTTAELENIGQRESEAGREVLKRMQDNITPEQKAQADNFFAGQMMPVGQNRIPAQTMIANAKAGPAAGVDAMAQLHKLGREGKLPSNMRIIARAGMDGS